MSALKKFRNRKIVMMIVDIVIMVLVGALAFTVLTFLNYTDDYNKRVVLSTLISTFFSFCVMFIAGVYDIRWRHLNPADYIRCAGCILCGVALSWTIMQMIGKPLGFSYWGCYFFGCSAGTLLFRFVFRSAFLYIEDSGREQLQKRTVIIGAGQATKMLLKEIDTNPVHCPYHPVALLDDDFKKQHTYLYDVPVKGKISDLPRICQQERVEVIMLAIPSLLEARRTEILNLCSHTSCEIKVLPYLSNLLESDRKNTMLQQMQDIRVEELLGRDPITFDSAEIQEFIRDKVCMVTGGGGSIGSELCRQIVKYNPKQLVIIDIYENNAYEIQQELIMEYGASLNLEVLIASVRDYDKMQQIFAQFRPNLVFHAAAHKHVPLMESSPEEAVKNNVMGTYHCASLADAYQVNKFVLISTDKAVNPTNVMGATKRCCEMVIQYMTQTKKHTEFAAVRFGNVLGSNGSVIPLFKRQIEAGKPVTVTHPDIIRYFMTIPEAVALILEAGEMAKGGEVFVLDMGQPVKIVSLAENLIRMYGKRPYKDVEIQFTGLRPGEKLYEELLMGEEGLQKTVNNKIFIGHQIEVNAKAFMDDLLALQQAAERNDSEETLTKLSEMVPTFVHGRDNGEQMIG